MSCRRAFEADMAAFAADPRAEVFADFRAHYPGCVECSAEVRAWTLLEQDLRRSASDQHPISSELLTYEQTPLELAASRRLQIESHLERCAGCADELRALGGFDFEALAPPPPGLFDRVRRAVARARLFVLHPAFAYALVLLLLYPAVSNVLRSPTYLDRMSEPSPPPYASVREFERLDRVDLEKSADEGESASAIEPSPPLAKEVFGAEELEPPRGAGLGEEFRTEASYGRASEPSHEATGVAHEADVSEEKSPPQARARAKESLSAAAGESFDPAPGERPTLRAAPSLAEAKTHRRIAPGTLGYRLDADAADRAAAVPPAPALSLDPARSRLTVHLPFSSSEASEVELVVQTADGRRALRERVRLPPRERTLTLMLPRQWLEPGDYVVEAFRADRTEREPLLRAPFSVR